MDFEMGKKSGQIPAFGDWDNANGLPITQYFESARQAGLLRYSNANTTATTTNHHHHHQNYPHQYCDNSYNSSSTRGNSGGVGYGAYPCNDAYAADFQKPPLRVVHVPYHTKAGHGGVSHGGEDCNGRRRRGCPPHLKEHQQTTKQVYEEVVDVKHQQHRTRRSSGSQQLLNGGQKKQFPKHSAIADVHKPSPTSSTSTTSAANTAAVAHNNVKPLDEDLYKIPPELLLHHSKRKKMLGFFSKCLVPPCSA